MSMITTKLEDLPQVVRANELQNLANNIVKYQNFKSSVIVNKIDHCNYSHATLLSILSAGIIYIKTGHQDRKIKHLYPYIDKAIKSCIQPLTPKQEEARLERTRKKKTLQGNSSVARVVESIYATAKENEKQYAVLMNKDYIRLVDSKESASMIVDTLNFVSKINCKIITVKIEEE